jgi:hypothetical protein
MAPITQATPKPNPHPAPPPMVYANQAYPSQPVQYQTSPQYQPQVQSYTINQNDNQQYQPNQLICVFDIPENVRKQYARFLRLEVYTNKVVGKGSKLGDVTYFYKNYMDVRWTPASLATQFAQIVFITHENASNYVYANNLTALNDVNKIPFCSGMFSYEEANRYAQQVFTAIKEAMTNYQNYDHSSTMQQVVIQNETSPSDEILKLKKLLDMNIITEEEFNAKKRQILGI